LLIDNLFGDKIARSFVPDTLRGCETIKSERGSEKYEVKFILAPDTFTRTRAPPSAPTNCERAKERETV
jgi:hypothetical protein